MLTFPSLDNRSKRIWYQNDPYQWCDSNINEPLRFMHNIYWPVVYQTGRVISSSNSQLPAQKCTSWVYHSDGLGAAGNNACKRCITYKSHEVDRIDCSVTRRQKVVGERSSNWLVASKSGYQPPKSPTSTRYQNSCLLINQTPLQSCCHNKTFTYITWIVYFVLVAKIQRFI